MKKIIQTSHAPAPISPYSQAVLCGNTLYVSGQIAIDPENNQLVTADLIEQTHRVMKNLQAILEEADMTFDNVVKSTIFLLDMSVFSQVNEIYAQYFKNLPPARETVAVAGLPKNVDVEISVIAVADR